MNKTLNRRVWLACSVVGALSPLTLHAPSAFAQAKPAVDPNDPTAKALGYVETSPNPAQKCGTCALYQGAATDTQGGCLLFQGKTVQAAGWCKSWAKKA